MRHYYNEFDPYAAQWLRNLIAEGCLPLGEVDTRDIRDVRPDDLKGYTSCHFFAGIGGWPLALRMAGWPDDRPVWTGSCPCQPFSAAGARKSFDDPRHLWPTWFRFIREFRPDIVFGEQVASPDGLRWFDLVSADLEGQDYTVGAADICAAGVGAPQIRQRLWFVGERLEHAPRDGREERRAEPSGRGAVARRGSKRLANTGRQRHEPERPELAEAPGREPEEVQEQRFRSDPGRVAVPDGPVVRGQPSTGNERLYGPHDQGDPNGGTDPHFPWRDPDWLLCTDGKWRPVEPGTFPLAHGVPCRVGKLRAYGNAIVPQVAAAFIKAYMGVDP